MAKNRTNSEPDDPVPDDFQHTSQSSKGNAPDSDSTSGRAARLAAIKAAVDAGEYDSDEMLDLALRKMIQRMPPDDDADDRSSDHTRS